MTESAKKQNADSLNDMLKTYLDNILKPKKNELLELEVKFGTRGIKSIARIDHDNVIKKLLSSGFTVLKNEYLLRIQNQFTDLKTGYIKMSNIRTELTGLQNVRTYCKTNSIDSIKHGISFMQKQNYKLPDEEAVVPVNFNDFNFRVSLNSEITLDKDSPIVNGLISSWTNSKKTFRYMNRYSFKHPNLPFIIDMSIVKESKRQGKYPIPEYSVQDAGVFNSREHYEVEIECINLNVGTGTIYNKPDLLNRELKKVIKTILSGLQETNYPVSYTEQTSVLQEYMKILWGDSATATGKILPKNFVGPSPFTLQIRNIEQNSSNSNTPNIRTNYTVTDKADGDRKLLFINGEGKIYLINTSMNVQFTGAITKNTDLFNSLLDGEHVIRNKNQKFINLYIAFDLYYLNGKDIRSAAFMPTTTEKVKKPDAAAIYRLPALVKVIKTLDARAIVPNETIPIRIEHKTFYADTPTQSIFIGCKTILDKVKDGLFEYETDGLIFTPANLGVGATKIGSETIELPLKKSWDYALKWKPDNTVDFLIAIKKTTAGNDYIGSTFQSGTDTSSDTQLNEFKTVILRVGFDEKHHGFINPCQDIIDDKLPEVRNVDNNDTYLPVQFHPTNPVDAFAGVTNILLKEGGSDEKVLMTEEGDVIEDNMIVEFRYAKDQKQQWKWIPLRVRYDKTAEFRAELKNFGNAYHVANSIWEAIHYEITNEMITTGENIPLTANEDDADVYWNKVGLTDDKRTESMRNFHNLFVKKILIKSVAKKGDTLIELAVGKGGDLPKWIDANLKFVFGVDISRDNIQNRLDGTCARFLNLKKNVKIMPACLFVQGDSSLNLRNGDALATDKDKQITKAVFGQGPKDASELGKGVYKQYGVGADGFDVCSIQFAIHYMFKTQDSFHNFLRNVSETTKLGGYFIGTSYDGAELFKRLSTVELNGKLTIMEDNKKLLEITKKYSQTEFPDNSSSIGYAIDVFQESINKTFTEYLVNYAYLTRMLENYGFVLLNREELNQMHLPASTGMFNELYHMMNEELKRNKLLVNQKPYKDAPNMTAGERKISFMNRYFIYKKVRIVEADKVAANLLNKPTTTLNAERDEEDRSRLATEAILQPTVAAVAAVVKPAVNLKKKLKLKIVEPPSK